MRRLAPVLVAALASSAGPTPANAQIYASERSTLSQTISGTVITIDYSRPSVRGRDSVFGKQVTWGEVWTPGANKATTLTITKPVRLGGQEVPAGSYSVWIAVRADSDWVFHLHPDTTRYHIPHPSATEMVFSLPVTPQRTDDVRETLTFDFEFVRANGAVLQLRWDHTLVGIDIEVENPLLMALLDSATGRRFEGLWTVTREGRDTTEPGNSGATYTMLTRYDQATGRIVGVWEYDEQADAEEVEPDFVLVPKAEGIFLFGFLMNGEVAEVDPSFFIEFAPETGRATTFVTRDEDDSIWSRGKRKT